MADYSFRITSITSFASDLNAMIVANGGYALPLLDQNNNLITAQLTPTVRMDFDVFTLTSGLRVNAKITTLPYVDQTQAATDLAIWEGAISSWFGLVTGQQPKCPTLANYTNATPDNEFPTAGQVWPTTGNTILQNPASTDPSARSW